MSESITIVLPLPNKVLSPNCMTGSFGGRILKATSTKKYRRQAREAVEAERVDTAPWTAVSVKASFYFRDARRRDQRNAESSLKAAYDGIVDAGLVADDDYHHMKGENTEFHVDKKNPRVMLRITRTDTPEENHA
jgi:Holliday junction resolvase RusA-like endonuclease